MIEQHGIRSMVHRPPGDKKAPTNERGRGLSACGGYFIRGLKFEEGDYSEASMAQRKPRKGRAAVVISHVRVAEAT